MNMALYKCCILFIIIIMSVSSVTSRSGIYMLLTGNHVNNESAKGDVNGLCWILINYTGNF